MQVRVEAISVLRFGSLDFGLSISPDGAKWFDTKVRRRMNSLGDDLVGLWACQGCLAEYCPELKDFSPQVVRIDFDYFRLDDDTWAVNSLALIFLCQLRSFDKTFRVSLPVIFADQIKDEHLEVLTRLTDLIATAIASDDEIYD